MNTSDGVFESVCPLDCPDTCSLEVTVAGGRVVRVDGSRRNPLTDGFICAKVRRYPARQHARERILTPLRRIGAKGEGAFEAIDWQAALDLVADRLTEVAQRHGGESILPYHYGGSNGLLGDDAADARFFHLLGASQLAKTLCAVPTGAVSQAMYGNMVGIPPTDYPLARCVVLWGVNPAATSIHTLRCVQEAKRRGTTVVVVDPRRTRTAALADVHLRPRPGTDVALALGMAHWIVAQGAHDASFLDSHARGWDSFRAAVDEWNVERAAEACGVAPAEIRRLADMYAAASPAVIRCGWGIERNRNGVDAARAVLALPAIAGKFGVRGGGFTMSMSSAHAVDKRRLQRPDLRAQPARTVNMTQLGRALTELDEPRIHALFVYNANPVASTPDQNRILAGLARDDLFTVVHEQVMTDTALWADVVLPATTIFEQEELHKSYGHTYLQSSAPIVPAAGSAVDNPTLFGRLAQRMGLGSPELFATETLAADAIGAERVEELRRTGVVDVGGDAAIVPFVNTWPRTPDRRIDLAPAELGPLRFRPAPADAPPLALLTPASMRLVNSIFGEFNLPEAVLCMHPDDARPRGIEKGAWVRVANELGVVEVRVQLDDSVLPGVVTLPKGAWRAATRNGSTSTALICDQVGDVGGGACFNDARVEVTRIYDE